VQQQIFEIKEAANRRDLLSEEHKQEAAAITANQISVSTMRTVSRSMGAA
jgi:hypothetical protein